MAAAIVLFVIAALGRGRSMASPQEVATCSASSCLDLPLASPRYKRPSKRAWAGNFRDGRRTRPCRGNTIGESLSRCVMSMWSRNPLGRT